MTDTLASLIERLEKAESGSRELDCLIAWETGWDCIKPEERIGWRFFYPQWRSHDDQAADNWGVPFYTTSIDAALTLVPGPSASGQHWRVFLERKPTHGQELWFATTREHAKDGWEAAAPTPALSLCIAALKARGARHD